MYGKNLFWCVLAGLPISVQAQPASLPDEAGDASADIVVTAQKRAERLQDVPISLSVQSAERLAEAGVTSTADLSKVVPGLIFAQNEVFSQPAIRGITTNIAVPGAESPVAIYLDGIYISGQTGSFFDLPDVERIEVLKGPQGTLFGRNATGGAIQIITRKPTFETAGSFNVSYGQFTGAGSSRSGGEVQAKGFISTPLTSTLAASLSGYYRTNDGYLV